MTLAELKQKRAQLATEMRSYHENQGDAEWGAEHREKWGKMREDIKRLDEQIGREEELRSNEQAYIDANVADVAKKAKQQAGELNEEELRSEAFNSFVRNGLSSLSEEQRNVYRQDEQRAMSVGSKEKGGYTVPNAFIARVHEEMKAYGGLASVAQVMVTDTGNVIEWPTSNGTSEEGELVGENSQANESEVEFGIASLGVHKLSSKIIRVSNELLNDSAIDMDSFLANRIASRIGRAEARLLVRGTGAGTPQQPKGLVQSVGVGKSTAAASTFGWKDVNGLIHSIDPAYRNAPQFRIGFNDATLQILEEMEDDKKRPLWLPSIAGVAPSSILGYSYFVDQGIPDIAAGAKFMFAGDFAQFIIRRVRYMALRRLTERYADFDQTAFLAFHRFGCVLQDGSAIKALQGKPAGGG